MGQGIALICKLGKFSTQILCANNISTFWSLIFAINYMIDLKNDFQVVDSEDLKFIVCQKTFSKI